MTDNAARFLGLAFASAELLVELDGEGRIVLALGAARRLTGRGEEALTGLPLSTLFSGDGALMADALLDALDTADRRGPVRVELAPAPGRTLRRYVSFSACRLPNLAPHISCALSLSAPSVVAEPRGALGLHDRAGLVAAVENLAKAPPGQVFDIAFVEFIGLAGATGRLPRDEARLALGKVAAALSAESLGGQTASQLAAERFALLRAGDEPSAALLDRLTRAVERAGVAVTATGASLSFDPAGGQSIRALKFALDNFIKDGAAAAGRAFSEVLAQTNAQARSFSQTVADNRFRLVYQPIVDLKSRELHHYEVLARLEDDQSSPASAIRLAEELDLIHDLDLAVADLAMRKLSAAADLSLAVNLSARSLMRPGFVETLLANAEAFRTLDSRLIFEITESAAIHDLEAANGLIQALRAKGFGVSLDDFGAGAAALSYLRALAVDSVKIDGQYVRGLTASGPANAVVRHITDLCRDLHLSTVAEMVETQSVADILTGMGVNLGQGYLFGAPAAEPSYVRPVTKVAPARRKGASETWG